MSPEEQYPLAWVKGFAASVKSHIHLRKEGSLIILPPNEAYRLNATGFSLFAEALQGKCIEKLINEKKVGPEIRADIYHFFCDLKSLISGCFGDGRSRKAVEQVPYKAPFSPLPILSEIAVTYRCNLACQFCYAGCNCHKKDNHSGEMSTAQVKKVLKIIKTRADVPSVSFTGGEPTLRPDLPRLIKYARKIGMKVNLITNGTLVDQSLARKLAEAGLNSAQVSFEGATAASHDALTQVQGSFEKTWRGIHLLAEAGINTQTNTTLNMANYQEAEEMVELIHNNGLKRFAMNMLTPSGSATDNAHLQITYSQIGEVVKKVKLRADALGIRFLWYSPTPYCLFNPIASGLGNKSCAACDGLLSVDPKGEILPCSSFDYGVGNILKEDFRKIWDSAQARFWRQKDYAPAQCDNCQSFQACAGACPLYWEARGTSELTSLNNEVAS